MLYFVELDMAERALESEWHAWYADHLQRILRVPGFLGAQRFRAQHPTESPFVAIYSITNAGVLASDPYRTRFGPDSAGIWKGRMTNWRRNLLEGVGEFPEVSPQGWLAVFDRRSSAAPPLGTSYTPLQPVGLDQSILERGLLIGAAGEPPPSPRAQDTWSLRIFQPLTPKIRGTSLPVAH